MAAATGWQGALVDCSLEVTPRQVPFLFQVRGALCGGLTDGGMLVDGLAQRLGIGAHTLRRRLDEHSTNHKIVLDWLRRDLAFELVKSSGKTYDEIATRLGFNEPRAFYLEFKRWSGTTPAVYRAQR